MFENNWDDSLESKFRKNFNRLSIIQHFLRKVCCTESSLEKFGNSVRKNIHVENFRGNIFRNSSEFFT